MLNKRNIKEIGTYFTKEKRNSRRRNICSGTPGSTTQQKNCHVIDPSLACLFNAMPHPLAPRDATPPPHFLTHGVASNSFRLTKYGNASCIYPTNQSVALTKTDC